MSNLGFSSHLFASKPSPETYSSLAYGGTQMLNPTKKLEEAGETHITILVGRIPGSSSTSQVLEIGLQIYVSQQI
jgi:hypothetical protein